MANIKNIYSFAKLLFLNILLISLLLVGCNNKDENKEMDEKISRLEKEAQRHIISKIKSQQNYFSKHKIFFKPPDEPATRYGSFQPIFGTQICYHYYTETSIDAVYSYAVQDDCGGMYGFELKSYGGAVFAVPITGDKQLKTETVSIVCKHVESYARVRIRPKYINGMTKCPPDTTIVFQRFN